MSHGNWPAPPSPAPWLAPLVPEADDPVALPLPPAPLAPPAADPVPDPEELAPEAVPEAELPEPELPDAELPDAELPEPELLEPELPEAALPDEPGMATSESPPEHAARRDTAQIPISTFVMPTHKPFPSRRPAPVADRPPDFAPQWAEPVPVLQKKEPHASLCRRCGPEGRFLPPRGGVPPLWARRASHRAYPRSRSRRPGAGPALRRQ